MKNKKSKCILVIRFRNEMLRLHRKQSGSLRVFILALHTETKKQGWCGGVGGGGWSAKCSRKLKEKKTECQLCFITMY